MAMHSTLASADAFAGVRTPARAVAGGAALLAVACVLGLVEASLPALPVVPWLRLGFANIAVVVALATAGLGTAAIVSIGRVVIIGLATGSLFSPAFAMSAAGAFAALLAMAAVQALGSRFSMVGWSVAGSVSHVVAQFAAASVVLGTSSVLALAPPSALLAVVFGVLVGSLARVAVSRIQQG
ncbi:Gx transporter family protein [bacterium]|nr:Gx transporter family protein [bacterium]